MNITFYGAAEDVTGSCHMVNAAGHKFLIDCGLFQGNLTDQMLNYEEFPFNIQEIEFMILTHAHIDHSGRIPKLYKAGYKNPVYCTSATRELCKIMLPDSGHIQENEIEWVNRKRMRAGKKPNDPIYTEQDAIDCLEIFKGLEYNTRIKVNDDISFELKDAGHMLGSAIVELYLKENGEEKKVVFTGDLGNKNLPIINDPVTIDSADILVMESTYGDRLHSSIKDQSSKFIQIILETIRRGGNVIIPSFAVGRTQEILYEINKYLTDDRVKDELSKVPVYVDSPLAVNATRIFESQHSYYDEEALSYLLKGDNPLVFDNLHFVETSEESQALNDDMEPKIIISASGMCEVGRIKHHLKHNLYRSECTILFVGYQAEGTLGRKIMNGEPLVKIFGEEIAVKAEIKSLDAFSGHADRDGLLNWVGAMNKKPEQIFIVHGEKEAQKVLKEYIEQGFKINSIIPAYQEQYDVNGTLLSDGKNSYKATRYNILELMTSLKEEVDTMTNNVKRNLKSDVDTEYLQTIVEKLKEVQDSIDNVNAQT
ncbi:MAG: MBL fold metallo-hydrolase RNA specificity domain-containing protein [Clostridia bacterium]